MDICVCEGTLLLCLPEDIAPAEQVTFSPFPGEAVAGERSDVDTITVDVEAPTGLLARFVSQAPRREKPSPYCRIVIANAEILRDSPYSYAPDPVI